MSLPLGIWDSPNKATSFQAHLFKWSPKLDYQCLALKNEQTIIDHSHSWKPTA